jgi:hypothetical protein
MHFQNNGIKRIIERNTITRYTTFYPRKPSWGRKPKKTSSIIDFQYNAKIKTKTPKTNQDQACTSPPSLDFFLQLQLSSRYAH